MPDEKDSSPAQREIRVLEIVGCFLMFFAILLLIAVTGGNTVRGRVTNLIAAVIILAVGGGMFWRGVARHRGAWLPPLVLFGALAVVSAVASLCLSRFTKVEETPEKAPVSEAAKAEGEKEAETEPGPSQQKKPGSFIVQALKGAGKAMRNVVQEIPPKSVKIVIAVGFLVIAAAVWLVRRKTVFEGVADRKWWRDLRLWTVVIVATQVVIYLLLGT